MTAPVVCVIPVYDAESTLPGVIAGVRAALPSARVLVVDDGSHDGSRAVAERDADRVVHFDRNRGKGAALRAGYAEAIAMDADVVLAIDADGQHDVTRAPALVDALAAADIAIGVRERRDSDMPAHRRWSNALSSAAISACAGVPLPDAQSGYRAMRADVARNIHAEGDRYEFESDFLIRAARHGYRIAGVPIPTIYGSPSHFRELRDAALVIRTIWHHRAWLWS